MNMIDVGRNFNLRIARETPSGVYLEDEEGDEVLLPFKYVPKGFKIGDPLKVFVYPDSEGRKIATTKCSILEIDQFGYVEAKSLSPFGMFMELGTDKDLLVPFSEQKADLTIGQYYVIYMFKDPITHRLVGSTNINRFLSSEPPEYSLNQEVDALVVEKGTVGWVCVVDNQFKGMVYFNQTFTPLKIGDRLRVYVNQIREDNKIDLSIRKHGYVHVNKASDDLLEGLRAHNGFLPLTDHSDPADIYKLLGMSKKSFKKSVGLLYKERLIAIEEKGIRLITSK
jgi:predicted RNA-binding protein (virulence factor B family)